MHITVLMATHNDAATVAAAVLSIQEQTYRDWDLIVIDDASSDGTAEIVAESAAADSRVVVLRQTINRGLPASLNLGLRHARGELIARMDADDISYPDRFAVEVEFLTQHPEIDVMGSAAEIIDEQGIKQGVVTRPSAHEELQRKIFKENPFVHPSIMARRRFFEILGGYDESLRRAQDYDLWVRGIRMFRYGNVDRPLLRYRVRRRPTFRSLLYGSLAIFRAVRRERKILTHGWCALRPLVSGVLIRWGLMKRRYR